MPFVRGFLGRWTPGAGAGQGLPGGEGGVDPGWGVEGPADPDTGLPELPPGFWGPGGRPGHGLPPQLPPKDEWPPLPPWLEPGVGLPIPPTVEHPWVPVLPGEEVDPPDIWPPLPSPPTMPDFSGKTLILATFHISRRVHITRWVIIDHEEVKSKWEKLLAWLKAQLPKPPTRPDRPIPGPGPHG